MSVSSMRSFEYLEQLPGTTFKRLYQQPSTALAIFRRMIPHLAKTFVMAMLFLTEPLPVEDLESWVRPDSRRYALPIPQPFACSTMEHRTALTDSHSELDRAVGLLERLHIFSAVNSHGRAAYRISNPFCNSLRLALTGGGNHNSFGVPCEKKEGDEIDASFLDEYARMQWEAILYYVVGSAAPGSLISLPITAGTRNLLKSGNLVETKGKADTITAAGFTFLLQDVNAQVWDVLIIYLARADNGDMDTVDVLAFLFTLGGLEIGQDYSVATLTPTQQKMLQDLSDLGIIYQQTAESPSFYPTRLATTLTSDSNPLTTSLTASTSVISTAVDSSTKNSRGFIVIETNYRIYAYTSSPLQISILALFTKLSTRYPNMVTGRLTKESIQHAISLGITSQQIISFLSAHAHPVMAERSRSTNATGSSGQAGQQSVLPPTVVDQVRLWQIEGDRMKTTQGFLFEAFDTREAYEACLNFAETIGVLVWKSDAKRSFFVTRHEQIASFLTNRKKRMAANGATS